MRILSMEWLEAATERALKTAGQFGVAAIGTVAWTNVDDVMPAGQLVGLALLFGLASSYLTSLASTPFGLPGPSLANEAIVPPAGEAATPLPDDGITDTIDDDEPDQP